jgi:hypothetical protein
MKCEVTYIVVRVYRMIYLYASLMMDNVYIVKILIDVAS